MIRLIAPALLCGAAAIVGSPAFAASAESVIWSFSGGADGTQPRGAVIFGTDGAIYGTTSSGGQNQGGTVFRLDQHQKTLTTIYSFQGGADGSLPDAALVLAKNGDLCGTTAMDGTGNNGTAFCLTPPATGATSWTKTTLWNFTGGADGGEPTAALIRDRAGSGGFFGTTNFGGHDNQGVVFFLSPPASAAGAWTEQVLYSFTGSADGAKPVAALVQGADGTLYGTTSAGGPAGAGTVFSLTRPTGTATSWGFTLLYSFTGGADGATPLSGLTLDSSGALYGTTEFGGQGDCAEPRYPYYPWPESETTPAYQAGYIPAGGNNCGVVYKVSPPASAGGAWTQSVIWPFQGLFDGGNPVSGLIFDTAGVLHGTTPEYGDNGPNALHQYADKGNVFYLTPPASGSTAWTSTTTLSSMFDTKGIYPRTELLAAPSGGHFTTETFGGAHWTHVLDYGFGTVILVP